MIVIEREIQNVRSGRWTELEELDKKFSAVESQQVEFYLALA